MNMLRELIHELDNSGATKNIIYNEIEVWYFEYCFRSFDFESEQHETIGSPYKHIFSWNEKGRNHYFVIILLLFFALDV